MKTAYQCWKDAQELTNAAPLPDHPDGLPTDSLEYLEWLEHVHDEHETRRDDDDA